MRRFIFLVHRWTGIAMCTLMALWFVSGVVMLFVGYPKLTPWERLSALPALPKTGCCIEPLQRGAAQAITLTSVAGRATYVLKEGSGRFTLIDAISGAAAPAASGATALAAARMYRPGVAAHYSGVVDEDRWTHGRGLNPHRPLHVVELDDQDRTRVYVSSTSGQVVLDAPRAERYWNYAGAWLHWLYMLRNQPTDPVWTWTLIGLSGAGVLSAVTGLLNGIWRWRFAGRYKNGTRTPYRATAMRWHHLLGLGFGLVLCTWMFSGLMSMNPLHVFDPALRPDSAAMQGTPRSQARIVATPGRLVGLLAGQNFHARELEWRVLDGAPFVLARDGQNNLRLVIEADGGLRVQQAWPRAQLEAAAARLLPYPVVSVDLLEQYDAFYYARGQASMYGGNERRLPALRVVFADPGQTWVYLDLQTGQPELSMDRSQRMGRWLFNLLHSWDLAALLTPGWPRDAVLILLSIGGLLLSATATLIAWRRLRLHFY